MNTKVALGVVLGIILAVVGYFLANRPQTLPAVSALPQETGTTTEPVKVIGAPAAISATKSPTVTPVTSPTKAHGTAPTITVVSSSKIALFDPKNVEMVTSVDHPTFSGTASPNVKAVSIIIVNSSGIGISGAWDIKVVDGKWDYTAPQALMPGIYTIQLLGGDTPLETKITITN
jgi:hypothetical protein